MSNTRPDLTTTEGVLDWVSSQQWIGNARYRVRGEIDITTVAEIAKAIRIKRQIERIINSESADAHPIMINACHVIINAAESLK